MADSKGILILQEGNGENGGMVQDMSHGCARAAKVRGYYCQKTAVTDRRYSWPDFGRRSNTALPSDEFKVTWAS